MKKCLVLGSNGMLGHVAARYLLDTGRYQIVECARGRPNGYAVDVTDFHAVRAMLEKEHPDYVLNCVGMLVKACSDNPAKAILVNSYFPHFLAELSNELEFRLIHVSTDCVFSGKDGAYRENAFRDGDTVYARTKALGEVVDEKNLTIRTSIIGPEIKESGTGLFHWFMNQHGTVRGYTHAIWSGVTTLELSKVVDAAICQGLTGLYQVAMPPISKYGLLMLFKKIWGRKDVTVEPYDGLYCDKSMLCTRTDFNYRMPVSHEKMLQELHDWYS